MRRVMLNGILSAWVLAVLFILMLLSFGSGCSAAKWQGAQETSKEPLHAESGAGVTVWKVPFVGIGSWGEGLFGYDHGNMPGAIIYNFNYQAKPPSGLEAAPGAPPTPPYSEKQEKKEGTAEGAAPLPPGAPPQVDYPTIYEGGHNDWSLVVFRNRTLRQVRIEISGEPQPIILGPNGATADMHFEEGEYPMRVVIERQSVMGQRETPRFFTLRIHSEGRPKIVEIREYSVSVRHFHYGFYGGYYGSYW